MNMSKALCKIVSLLVLMSFLSTSNVYGLRPALKCSDTSERTVERSKSNLEAIYGASEEIPIHEMQEIAVAIAGISSFLERYPGQFAEAREVGINNVIRQYLQGVPDITEEQLSEATTQIHSQYNDIISTLVANGFSEGHISQLNQAFALALYLHSIQKRASRDSRPYFIHSAGVTHILVDKYKLLEFIQDKNEAIDILSAAFLHDAIEDAAKGILGKSEIPEGVEDEEAYLRSKATTIIAGATNRNAVDTILALTKMPYGTDGLDEFEIERLKIKSLQTAPIGTKLIKMADWHFNFGDLKNSTSGEFTAKFVNKRLPPIIDFLGVMKELPASMKTAFVNHVVSEGGYNNSINLQRGFDGSTMTKEQFAALEETVTMFDGSGVDEQTIQTAIIGLAQRILEKRDKILATAKAKKSWFGNQKFAIAPAATYAPTGGKTLQIGIDHHRYLGEAEPLQDKDSKIIRARISAVQGSDWDKVIFEPDDGFEDIVRKLCKVTDVPADVVLAQARSSLPIYTSEKERHIDTYIKLLTESILGHWSRDIQEQGLGADCSMRLIPNPSPTARGMMLLYYPKNEPVPKYRCPLQSSYAIELRKVIENEWKWGKVWGFYLNETSWDGLNREIIEKLSTRAGLSRTVVAKKQKSEPTNPGWQSYEPGEISEDAKAEFIRNATKPLRTQRKIEKIDSKINVLKSRIHNLEIDSEERKKSRAYYLSKTAVSEGKLLNYYDKMYSWTCKQEKKLRSFISKLNIQLEKLTDKRARLIAKKPSRIAGLLKNLRKRIASGI